MLAFKTVTRPAVTLGGFSPKQWNCDKGNGKKAMTDSVDQTVEKDRTALLNQLRIDRTQPPSSEGHGKWWATGIAIVIVGASGIWYLMRPTGVIVTTAIAQPAAGGGAAAGASLLDASGYIVARRRATVSSKTMSSRPRASSSATGVIVLPFILKSRSVPCDTSAKGRCMTSHA